MVMVSGHKHPPLGTSRYCKQTQFLYMWDYLWSDKDITHMQVDIAEHKT